MLWPHLACWVVLLHLQQCLLLQVLQEDEEPAVHISHVLTLSKHTRCQAAAQLDHTWCRRQGTDGGEAEQCSSTAA
jgi:hypothetical protein